MSRSSASGRPDPAAGTERGVRAEPGGSGQDMTTLTFPETEAACLRRHYADARVILEYGAGGSTLLGASLPGKLVLSVESDRAWAIRLQKEIDEADLPSPAVVWYSDIGRTGAWGRPLDDSAWPRFHRYPLGIWDQEFFRHPDLVLVDGRFRCACFAGVCLRITRPVRLLFDDYVERAPYHAVERLAKPTEIVGRMAIFDLQPGLVRPDVVTHVFEMFTQVTYAAPRKARGPDTAVAGPGHRG